MDLDQLLAGGGDGRPVAEIVASPVPENVFRRAMIAITLVANANADNFNDIAKYIRQPAFSVEYSMLVMLGATRKDPKLCDTSGFVNWAKASSGLFEL